ncbi:Beta-1,3-galactosyl-O-glycosyl-glycoprotein beta-1,6-N-acetylglucosaminyltransferase [Merluccius polli]|uniref:Beta-1,3-galactosyl-O-glycosyl-glycoprotein beta-1,6-N-acetylglucosaminyltransferase n=1 Tax=Merluccius polli TaxID=89951 RepID=A0AA47MV78_MERPO|nr:Beta-1,3-galactosyl-O-glycosyl-glycoprotein beta-1,6-N-acetylglucosaminyltransferase [Merluccius polli]
MAFPFNINANQLLSGILSLAAVITLWCIFTLETTNDRWVPQYNRTAGWLEALEDPWAEEASLNCTAVVLGDPQAMDNVRLLALTKDYVKTALLSDEYYTKATQDCRSKRGYSTWALQEEMDFPLAYSIVAHHKVQNFERLLRAIYMPHNVYCVHVDTKAKASVLAAITSIASCFHNVFMVSRAVSVVYAGWSRVQADLNCMSDLEKVSTDWKYLINLCGQDFPLKTNLETVRSLRALAGANNMESIPIPVHKKWRVESAFRVVKGVLKVNMSSDRKQHKTSGNNDQHFGNKTEEVT